MMLRFIFSALMVGVFCAPVMAMDTSEQIPYRLYYPLWNGTCIQAGVVFDIVQSGNNKGTLFYNLYYADLAENNPTQMKENTVNILPYWDTVDFKMPNKMINFFELNRDKKPMKIKDKTYYRIRLEPGSKEKLVNNFRKCKEVDEHIKIGQKVRAEALKANSIETYVLQGM